MCLGTFILNELRQRQAAEEESRKDKCPRRRRKITAWNCFFHEQSRGLLSGPGRRTSTFSAVCKAISAAYQNLSKEQYQKYVLWARCANARARSSLRAFPVAGRVEGQHRGQEHVETLVAFIRGGCVGRILLPTDGAMANIEEVQWVFRSASLRLAKLRGQDEKQQHEARSQHAREVGVTEVVRDQRTCLVCMIFCPSVMLSWNVFFGERSKNVQFLC